MPDLQEGDANMRLYRTLENTKALKLLSFGSAHQLNTR